MVTSHERRPVRSHTLRHRYALVRLRRRVSRAVLYLTVLLVAVILGAPFLWAVSSSLKAYNELFIFPPKWLPTPPQWGNYAQVWQLAPFGRFVLNSLVFSIATVVSVVASSALVGYGFARFRFPGRDALFLVVLSMLMLPAQVTVIPRFLLFKALGWLDTYKPLWVPWLFGGSAFGIFLYRQFFLTIPKDLDEAATIDGANFITILLRILMPLSMPITITQAILAFLYSWNELFWPVIILNTYEKYPLALGLQYFRSTATAGGQPREHLMMAASMMMTLPCVVLYVTLQRYFTRGIVMSGIKG
jgi:ABC-type glycerol-3-phosphate transport system permease component